MRERPRVPPKPTRKGPPKRDPGRKTPLREPPPEDPPKPPVREPPDEAREAAPLLDVRVTHPERLTIRTVPTRLHRAEPWAEMGRLSQTTTAAMFRNVARGSM
jgi:hypothetical protein